MSPQGRPKGESAPKHDSAEDSPMSTPIDDALYLDAIAEVTWKELVGASGLPDGIFSRFRDFVPFP